MDELRAKGIDHLTHEEFIEFKRLQASFGSIKSSGLGVCPLGRTGTPLENVSHTIMPSQTGTSNLGTSKDRDQVFEGRVQLWVLLLPWPFFVT